MNFDQGDFNFDAPGSEAGYRKWQQELDASKRAFELRHGIILGRRVKVCLLNEPRPLEGMIYLVTKKNEGGKVRLRLSIGNREFSPAEIESIVTADEVSPTGESAS